MKKLLTVLALTLMTVVIALTVSGCGTDTSAVDNLADKVDELTARIDDLEKENEDLTNQLKNQVNNLNVFWTNKAEYSETETMTIYFGEKAVFKICIYLSNSSGTALSGKACNNALIITSLCSDIYADSIVATSFLLWENGTCLRTTSTSTTILKRNSETKVANQYNATESISAGAQWYDLVICVPGTPFELARFKNVSFSL